MASAVNEKPVAPQEKTGISQHERVGSRESSDVSRNDLDPIDVNEKLVNPLAGLSSAQVQEDAVRFANNNGLSHLADDFRKAALVAQDPEGTSPLPMTPT